MRPILKFLSLVCLLSLTPKLWASAYTLRLGPAAFGNGGSNPLGIPPGILDVEMSYMTDANTIFNFAVTHIWVGKWLKLENNIMLGIGPGLLYSINGLGLGGILAVGYEPCGEQGLCFSAALTQGLGTLGRTLVSPYALRLGITWRL